jgi:glycosyltransferase involved in cell wall biosynthesis
MSITVGVCVRNGRQFMKECLGALEAQSVQPDEVIVVNDHSTDRTAEVVQEIQAQSHLNLQLLGNEGTGVYDGRNTVLQHASHEFLAFTDSDCVVDRHWIERILAVFHEHPEVAAGTGAYPPMGPQNWVSKLHRWWFVVEGKRGQGYTDGVVGGNSYFRRKVLEQVGGWVSLPLVGAGADDVYISLKITQAGHQIWFDDEIKAYHGYTTSFRGLMRKAYRDGRAIVLMMRASQLRGFLYWYTLGIPIAAAMLLAGLCLTALLEEKIPGILFLTMPLLVTLVITMRRFGSMLKSLPRWITRWILIWGYSVGVLRGMTMEIRQ